MSGPSRRLARWRLRLSEFDLAIQYRKGIKNCQSGALARLRMSAEARNSTVNFGVFWFDELDDCAFTDFKIDAYNILLVTQAITAGEATYASIDMATLEQEQIHVPLCRKSWKRINEGLHISFKLSGNRLLQYVVRLSPNVVIPKSLHQLIVHKAHHTQSAGLPGARKTCYCVCRPFCLSSVSVDEYNVVKNCAPCARERIKFYKHATELRLFLATDPLAYVSTDIPGRRIESNKDKRFY